MATGLPGCAQTPTNMNDLPAVRAPELEPNQGWLNTDKPLRFSRELKGQIVLLDFWTYCCINCMHILPDLEYLEKKYANDPVTIIGVHSAKFENEASRETIRAAIQRYKIHHPVVIDDDMAIWNRYTAQGWPTFVLIDSRGRVVAMDSGEGHRQAIDSAIEKLLKEGKADNTLASGPLHLRSDVALMPTGELAFPGKVLVDEKTNRLFTADSNHNRVIVSTIPDSAGNSKLLSIIGSGKEGKTDGAFQAVTFHNPQGLALRGNLLYIADTDNHLIREANLETSTVRTIAGTGEQGYDRQGGGKGTGQAISSPWDLQVNGDRLYIAMAGLHQIWVMDLGTGTIKVLSGSGSENIHDGPADEAEFAQPSGLALLNGKLYVADSEVSGLREVDLTTGQAKTIVGQGLFVFGDKDGRGDEVRLQHALGVAAWKNGLLIADTYNHKIKRADPETREVKTLFGTGKPATKTSEGKPAFFEPGGLSVAGDRLFVADTNNHRVVTINLADNSWSEVKIQGLTRPKTSEVPANALLVPAAKIKSDASSVTLTLNAKLPSNAHPSAEAPMLVRVADGEKSLLQQTLKTDKLPVQLEINGADIPASGTLSIRWSFAWCTEGNASVCVPQRRDWQVPVEKTPQGETSIMLEAKSEKE